MKLELEYQPTTYHVNDWVNPRGNLARDYQRVGKNAVWLIHLCSLWLSHKHGDEHEATYDPPHELPKVYPDAKRINLAIKQCGLWERYEENAHRVKVKRAANGSLSVTRGGKKASDPISIAAAHRLQIDVIGWHNVFSMWLGGSLERQLDGLLGFVPSENGEAIRQEMLK